MQFANPNALWWLLLSLPIVALYLLQQSPRRVTTSTRMFWDELLPETTPRRWWQRLRDPLSLLVTLLLLLLVTLAMARPQRFGDSQKPRSFIVVLDNSASMQATDGASGKSRFADAKAYVLRLIDQLRDEDEMALLSTAPTARQVMRRTSSRAQLRRALRQLRVSDSPGTPTAAVKLARRITVEDNRRAAKIHWVTDGQRKLRERILPDEGEISAPETDVPPDSDVSPPSLHTRVVGQERSNNIAITKFQVRRPYDDPMGFELYTEVSSFSDQPTDMQLELIVEQSVRSTAPADSPNETLLDVIPFSISPNAQWRRVTTGILPVGARIRGTITSVSKLPTQDALSIDDTAVSFLASQTVAVALLSDRDRYLNQALRSISWIELTVHQSVADLANRIADLPKNSIVVFDTVSEPADERDGLIETLTNQRADVHLLFVRPPSIPMLWQMGNELDALPITGQSSASSLLQHVELVGQIAHGARQCQLEASGWETVVSVEGNIPIVARGPHSYGGRCLLLNLDPAAGDLVWRTSFPLFVSNAMQWLNGQSGQTESSYRTGETVLQSTLANWRQDQDKIVLSPSGRRLPITDRVGPLDEVGFWQVMAASAKGSPSPKRDETLEIAVNLANVQESNLRQIVTNTNDKRAASKASRPIWFYLLLVAFVMTIVEWTLVQRRWLS